MIFSGSSFRRSTSHISQGQASLSNLNVNVLALPSSQLIVSVAFDLSAVIAVGFIDTIVI
jgi:hypothetical protein